MLPKIEVPAELRALAEKSIDQAEQAFSLFFAAANRSLRAMPNIAPRRRATSSIATVAPEPPADQRTLRSLTRVAVDRSLRSSRQVGWLKWITKSPL